MVKKSLSERFRRWSKRTTKNVVKTSKQIDKGLGVSKSLKSKAIYRKGPSIGTSYNIHKQLEPPATYEDEPARYYKKIYKEEKKNFFFK